MACVSLQLTQGTSRFYTVRTVLFKRPIELYLFHSILTSKRWKNTAPYYSFAFPVCKYDCLLKESSRGVCFSLLLVTYTFSLYSCQCSQSLLCLHLEHLSFLFLLVFKRWPYSSPLTVLPLCSMLHVCQLVPHPQIQPTAEQKRLGKTKIPESFKKENLNLPCNCLHRIYMIFPTIYIIYTLYQVL